MAPASSPSLHSDSSRLKWKKRKRESNLKKRKTHDDDDDDDEDEEEAAVAAEDDDQGPFANDLCVDFRENETIEEGVRVSDFPFVLQSVVKRPHPTVLAIVAAERCTDQGKRPKFALSIENISHGQLQSLSAVLPDNPSLSCQVEPDKPHTYVCTPPDLMAAKGVVKRFGKEHALIVPAHADWFDPRTVHRQERQVVPHYFSGKSTDDHTPEKYMTIRNTIVAKYMENPRKRLSLAECQGIVSTKELFDLSRIVRFLDNWGIINYMAEPVFRGPRVTASLVREEFNGELQVNTAPLKSIDSLVLFDRPRSSHRTDDVSSLASTTVNYGEDSFDFDTRIREQLSDHWCNYCLRHLFTSYYQSIKEADMVLCPECYHDAKFLVGHSSLDFVRLDYQMDSYDGDGDSWTDHETLLLLEALEKYNDNWDEVATHVGTKSKAQCIVHFIRLQTEDSVLEKVEFPQVPVSSDDKEDTNGILYADSNGSDLQDDISGDQFPFCNASNPIMSLVAFLAVCLGPRMAASCACAALSILTKDDSSLESLDRVDSGTLCPEDGLSRDQLSLGNQRDNSISNQGSNGETDSPHPLCAEKVKHAAVVGLSAAAVKTKLFADQEEREIQRLSATIINHQLKRLELKLKQFAEIETLLLKECEQVERGRQRLYGERIRIISAKFGQTMPPPSSSSMPPMVPPSTTMNMNTRPPSGVTVGGTVQGNIIPPVYGNNLAAAHPQMAAFMQSQAAMFPFVGPRLPLSAIHPSSAPQSSSLMIPSAPSGTTSLANQQNLLLRSLSGNNSSIGQG